MECKSDRSTTEQILNLHCNELSALPENMGEFMNLVILIVSENKLRGLPSSMEAITTLEVRTSSDICLPLLRLS